MTKSMFLIATGLLASVASVSQAQAAPVIGAPIVVYSTGNVFATFLGSAASYKS